MAEMENVDGKNSQLFQSECDKIAVLVYARIDGDKEVLNKIFDSLNELDYNLFCVKKERGVLLINQCCYIIPPEETSLAAKAITLFTNLLTKGQIIVGGKTLSVAVSWCLETLKHGNQINTLKCLQLFVKGNGKIIEQDCHHLLSELEKISNNFTFSTNEEICLNCLRCVEAVTLCTDKSEKLPAEIILKCFGIFKKVLYKEKSNKIDNHLIFCKYLITAMRGIENLVQNYKEITSSELDKILGIVKGYMLYGLIDSNNYKVQKILPSSATIPEVLKSNSQSVKKLRGKYDRRPKKVAVTSITEVEETEDANASDDYLNSSQATHQVESLVVPYKTSDSEFSDSEFGHGTKIKFYETKVRLAALILMGTTVRETDPKVFIAYLPSFLPDGLNLPNVRTLITCLLKEPSAKCRCEVLGVLLMIISNSRPYFLQADSISKSSFTTFSCTISNIIKELHRSLVLNLVTDKNNAALKRNLKCIADLIRCSPYHKMEPGLITYIAKHVKSFLKHKDINIQIFSLTVFGCIVSVEPKVAEIKSIILCTEKRHNESENISDTNTPVDDCEVNDDEDYKTDTVKEKSWLLDLCFQNLSSKNRNWESSTNAALQVEFLHVLGALVRNFFKETLLSFPNEIIELLQHCSERSEYSIRLFTGKLMETVLNAVQYSFCQEDETKTAPISLVIHLWESMIFGPILMLLDDEEPMLRCTGCDCLANIGVQVPNGQMSTIQNSLIFDQLPMVVQFTCLAIVSECILDKTPAVRCSGVRALAFFVLFPSLRQDSSFLLDVVKAIPDIVNDENSTVRIQASWLFGNLSEAAVLNKRENVDGDFPADVLTKLLKVGITLSSDNPKIKPGAVRGIGNFLQIVSDDFMKENKDLIYEAIDALIKNATTGNFMKARWNSCYAIGNLLQNPVIHRNNEWMIKIFNVMASLVQHYKNFKVRVSAGFVLGVAPTRECYGERYNFVWSAVLNALENSKNISDFNEYQHRDQLVDQLCLVICHLVSVMKRRDLNSLQDVLHFHLDNLSYFMSKFKERIVPEKSNVLLNATEKINQLKRDKNLTVEERDVVRLLDNFFVFCI